MNYLNLINDHLKNDNCIFCIENKYYKTIRLLDDYVDECRYCCDKCEINYHVSFISEDDKNLFSIMLHFEKYSLSFNSKDITIYYQNFSDEIMVNIDLYDKEMKKYFNIPHFKIEKWNVGKLEQKIN